jgi:hypothetical protein
LRGGKGVTNEIEVQPRVSAADVKTDIEEETK